MEIRVVSSRPRVASDDGEHEIAVDRYVCVDCGYTEEYVASESDLKLLANVGRSHTHPEPFGARVLDEIRERGLFSQLTQRMDYAQIQRFKDADRGTVVRLFAGGPQGYVAVQRLETASPSEIVDVLQQDVLARTQNGALAAAILLGSF